jgi:hypothetical protein
LDETNRLIQKIFKRQGVAFKEDGKALLFRYPNIPVIQPFVAFGLLELLVIEPGRRVEVKIVGKSYMIAFVCTTLLAIGIVVDTTSRNQSMSGIELVILLFVLGLLLIWFPSAMWQRFTFNKVVTIVKTSLSSPS